MKKRFFRSQRARAKRRCVFFVRAKTSGTGWISSFFRDYEAIQDTLTFQRLSASHRRLRYLDGLQRAPRHTESRDPHSHASAANMACTSAFVGTPASLRAPAATRSARARVSVRADASPAATCVVTPATVKSRSGSASVKGTVRKQNEDRFASYVRISSRSSPQPRRVSALAVVATPRRRATTTDPTTRHLRRSETRPRNIFLPTR